MDEIRYERDMYEPLRDYLNGCGFDVRSEVNKCDLVAKRSDYLIIVEMKRHLSFDLLEQAIERQSYADAVYVCIPKPPKFKTDKSWRSKMRVLKRLGLGLLLVGKMGTLYTVEEALSPQQNISAKDIAADRVLGNPTEEGMPHDSIPLDIMPPYIPPRTSAKKRLALTKEFHNRSLDLNTGGTHSLPLVTAYRECALFLVFLLDLHGPLTPKAMRSFGAHPTKTTAILRANYYGWFEKTPDKCFALTDTGKDAMALYAPLICAFRENSGSM